jgi:hypothetical protein
MQRIGDITTQLRDLQNIPGPRIAGYPNHVRRCTAVAGEKGTLLCDSAWQDGQ